jgi:hypothetical protein
MKTRLSEVITPKFLTSAVVRGELPAPDTSPPRKLEIAPGTNWIGGWVDPRTGLDAVEKGQFFPLPGLELRTIGRSARCHSLE